MKKISVLLLVMITVSINLWAEDRPSRILETEALLNKIWNEVKTELRHGNIDKAVEFFSPAYREEHREGFNRLRGQLSQIFSRPDKIRLIRISENVATCDLITVENDGKKHSSPMEFVLINGEWKIVNY